MLRGRRRKYFIALGKPPDELMPPTILLLWRALACRSLEQSLGCKLQCSMGSTYVQIKFVTGQHTRNNCSGMSYAASCFRGATRYVRTLSSTKNTFMAPDSEMMAASASLLSWLDMVYRTCKHVLGTCQGYVCACQSHYSILTERCLPWLLQATSSPTASQFCFQDKFGCAAMFLPAWSSERLSYLPA